MSAGQRLIENSGRCLQMSTKIPGIMFTDVNY